MLKTLSIESAKPKKGGVKVGGDSRAWHDGSDIDESGVDNVEVDGDKVEFDEVGEKVQKMSKSKNLSKFKKTVKSLNFLTPGAKLVFTKLR